MDKCYLVVGDGQFDDLVGYCLQTNTVTRADAAIGDGVQESHVRCIREARYKDNEPSKSSECVQVGNLEMRQCCMFRFLLN